MVFRRWFLYTFIGSGRRKSFSTAFRVAQRRISFTDILGSAGRNPSQTYAERRRVSLLGIGAAGGEVRQVRLFRASGGIINLNGDRIAELHKPEQNLNVLYPKVFIPMLSGKISTGRSLLACAVFAATTDDCAGTQQLREEIPEFICDVSAGKFVVRYRGKDTYIDMRSQWRA